MSKIDLFEQIKLELNKTTPKICPHCHHNSFYRHGYYKGMQRYKCNKCRRTFIPITGTAIYYLHKKSEFIKCLNIVKVEGVLTLKIMRNRLNISNQTAFDWRHKLLMTLVDKKILLKKEIYYNQVDMNFTVKGRKGAKIDTNLFKFRTTKDLLKICTLKNTERLKMKIARIGFWINSNDIKRTVESSITIGAKVFLLFGTFISKDKIRKKDCFI